LQHTTDKQTKPVPNVFGGDSGLEAAHSSYAFLQAFYEQLAYVLEESAEHHCAAEEDFTAREPAQHLPVAPLQPRRHTTHTLEALPQQVGHALKHTFWMSWSLWAHRYRVAHPAPHSLYAFEGVWGMSCGLAKVPFEAPWMCGQFWFMRWCGFAQMWLFGMVFGWCRRAFECAPFDYAFHLFAEGIQAFFKGFQLLAERHYLAQKRVAFFEARSFLLGSGALGWSLRHKWQADSHGKHCHKSYHRLSLQNVRQRD